MRFKNLFLILFALTLFLQYGFTTIELTVGRTPSYVYGYYDINVHDFKLLVITSGYDANFNGIQDPEDESPAIYTISFQSFSQGNFNGTKLVDLPFAPIPFPMRPGIAPTRNSIFIPVGNVVNEYNLTNGSLINSIIPFDTTSSFTSYSPAGVYYNSNLNYLFVSLRTYGTGIDKVNIIDLANFSTIDSIIIGDKELLNPQQIFAFENNLYVLYEGTFGTNNSHLVKVDLSTIGTGNHDITEVLLGSGGNHIYPSTNGDQKFIVVTMNYDGEVHFLNPNTLSFELSLELPAKGYDGPRETYVYGGEVPYVTAYNGNLYIQRSNNQLDSIYFGNKLESIFGYKSPNPMITFETIAITSPFKNDYTPNDKVYVLTELSTVDEKISVKPSNYSINPNPATDYIILNLGNEILEPVEIEIVDIWGNNVLSYNFDMLGKQVALPLTKLSQGTYFARLIGKTFYQTIPFVIIP